MRAQPLQGRDVDRDAGPLDRRRRRHVGASEKRVRQIEIGQHCRQKAVKRIDVGLAIIEKIGLLSFSPGPAAQSEFAHFLLLIGADMIQSMEHKRAEKPAAGRNR